MKRKLLCRPERAALPLVLAIAALLGRSDAAFAIFFWDTLARIPALCTDFALWRAAGTALTARKLRGNWTCALLVTVLGGGLLTIAAAVLPANLPAFSGWNAVAPPEAIWPLAAFGTLLAIERLFAEHLRAQGQAFSAFLLEMVTALLILAALFLGNRFWWLWAGGISLLIAVATGIAIAGNPFGSPNAAPLREVPGAAARELLYPLIAIVLCAAVEPFPSRLVLAAPTCAALLAGQAVFAGTQAAFRRTEEESAAIGWWLTLSAGMLLCAEAVLPIFVPIAREKLLNFREFCAWGALCALWTGASLRPRAAASLLMATGAAVLLSLTHVDLLDMGQETLWGTLMLSFGAVVLRIADARLLFLRARARMLRRKAVQPHAGANGSGK